MNLTEHGYLMEEISDNMGALEDMHRNCSGWRWNESEQTQTKVVPIEYPTSLDYTKNLVEQGVLDGGAGGHDLRCVVRLAEVTVDIDVEIVPRKG